MGSISSLEATYIYGLDRSYMYSAECKHISDPLLIISSWTTHLAGQHVCDHVVDGNHIVILGGKDAPPHEASLLPVMGVIGQVPKDVPDEVLGALPRDNHRLGNKERAAGVGTETLPNSKKEAGKGLLGCSGIMTEGLEQQLDSHVCVQAEDGYVVPELMALDASSDDAGPVPPRDNGKDLSEVPCHDKDLAPKREVGCPHKRPQSPVNSAISPFVCHWSLIPYDEMGCYDQLCLVALLLDGAAAVISEASARDAE